MVGNDIVDLKLASIQSNWQRNGFLNKVFTEEEQTMIHNSMNPFQLVWLFWSMKESVYKIYVRKYQKRFFAPKKFRCELITEDQGLVTVSNGQYFTNSKITSAYIFTEAVGAYANEVEHHYFKLINTGYSMQSKAVYNKLRKAISTKKAESINTIHIKKDRLGVPKLYQNTKQLKVSFSISHHGDYGAYSILNILE